jgi:trigger factor
VTFGHAPDPRILVDRLCGSTLSALLHHFRNQPTATVNVTVKDISATRKDIVVTVPGDTIAAEEARLLKKLSGELRIPGFRPGKAPEPMVRARYRKQLQEELDRAMYGKVYEEAVRNSGLDVYSVVEYPETSGFSPGAEAVIEMTVDITPAFELPAYKSLETRIAPVAVDDAEIDDTITTIRRQRAEFVAVERAAAAGDYVKVSYQGTVDGQPIAALLGDETKHRSWAGVENGWEEAGTEEARTYGVPAVIDALVGMAAGASAEVTQVFDDACPVEALRGKQGSYALTVHEVRERKLPEIDAGFLKSVKAESLEDLRDQIYQDLERRKRRDSEQSQRQQIIRQLLAAVDFELPASAIETETQNVMGRIMVDNMQRGVPEEEFEKHKEQLHAQSQEIARHDVKLHLLLGRIAREEKIEVEEQDMQRAIYNVALQTRQRAEEVIRDLRRNRNRLLGLQRQILFGKTLDLLVREAKVVEDASIKAEDKQEHDHDHHHDHHHDHNH